MSTELHPPSAKIYAFPAGGRAGLKARAIAADEYDDVAAAFGSGWYHDAAIEEAKKPSSERELPARLYPDRH